ncbi:MAG: MFS transporter [Actinomycetota bacterium]|nr:MFS transporter [Actinomycetota bacterium]
MPPSSVLEPIPRTAPQWSSPPRRRVAASPSVSLLVILAAQMMVVLDATIVNVALPHIQTALGFTSTSLSWVLNAYILTFGGLLLLGARSGDLLGRRRVFVTGIALFSLASLAGGFAQAGWMLLTARALQGIGGALAAPSALALLTTLFPEGAARLRAIALFTTVSAAGGAIGLVAGGMLTEWVGWRWVMFVNVPIGLVVALLARRVIGETPVRHGRFDAAGAVTSTLGMTGLVLGLVQAGTDGWASPVTVAALAGGAALLAAFVAVEQRAVEPVLPLRLVTHATRSAANVARGLVYSGMYGMFFFLSQFLQEIQHYSPLRAGLSFLPMPVSVFLSSQLTSRVLVRRLVPKQLMLLGIAVATGGLAVASQLTPSSRYLEVLGALALMGAGSGVSFVSLTTASLAGVAPEDAGAASGLINVSQQLGAALGVAVLVTVFAAATDHISIASHLGAPAVATLTHGLHVAFGVGVLFALLGLGSVAAFVRRSDGRATTATFEEELAELEVIDAVL